MQWYTKAGQAVSRTVAVAVTGGLLVAGSATGSAESQGMRLAPHAHTSGAVTVTVWQGWSGDEAKQFHKLVAKFNATHAGIHVNTLDNVDYQKLLTAVAGGTPPDVAELFSDYIGTFATKGVIQPLDSLAQSA